MTKVSQHRLPEVLGSRLAGHPAGRSLVALGPIRGQLGDLKKINPYFDQLLYRRISFSLLGPEHTDRRRRDVADHASLLERLFRGGLRKRQRWLNLAFRD